VSVIYARAGAMRDTGKRRTVSASRTDNSSTRSDFALEARERARRASAQTRDRQLPRPGAFLRFARQVRTKEEAEADAPAAAETERCALKITDMRRMAPLRPQQR